MILTFTMTPEAVRDRVKKVTRRPKWSERTVRMFTKAYEQGLLVDAYDRNPRQRGRKIETIRLTDRPYQETLANFPADDCALEGFDYYEGEERCHPKLREALRDMPLLDKVLPKLYGVGLHEPVWVVRFEYVDPETGEVV